MFLGLDIKCSQSWTKSYLSKNLGKILNMKFNQNSFIQSEVIYYMRRRPWRSNRC
jgi:hypothetical protein